MKRIIKLLFVVLLLLTVCGCHGQRQSTSFKTPDSFDESKHYEITFWAKNDSNVNQVNVYKKAISDFEKIYPNISVKLSLYTDYTQIYNDVITNISTNTTPNVCITYPDHIATYITGNNVVTPLDDLITNEKYGLGGSEIKFDGPKYDEVISEYLNEGKIGDIQYAIPFMRSTEALYINADFVKKLGYEIPEVVTWDFVWTVSEDAISRKNTDGTYFVNDQNILIPFIYKSTDNMMIQTLHQLDAEYSDESGNIKIFNDTTRDFLYEISKHVKTGAFSTFKISSYPANFLNAGQSIFAIDSTAGSTWMGSDAPLIDIPEDQLVPFETVVKIIPQYDEKNISMISQGPSICVFNKDDSNEVLASWLFAQFLLTNDVQFGYGKTEGYVPVTHKCQNSDDYLEYLAKAGEDGDEHYKTKIESTKLLIENVDKTFTTPVFNGSASLRTASGQLIEETAKATRRSKTINDEFFKNLYSEINSLYRLDQKNSVNINKDLGELPIESKALLFSLAFVWILIGAYVIYKKAKNN